MANLEQVKERLKSALNNVNNKLIDAQKAIQSQQRLEIENNELKANIILLQKEISELKQKIRSMSIEQEQKSLNKQPQVAAEEEQKSSNPKVRKASTKSDLTDSGNENKVSLNELKDLVRNKKWG